MKLKIGENIRDFRKKNDMTQEALADRLGVTYQSISRWENGTTYPDLELLPVISKVLGVSVDKLLGMPQIEKEKKAEETYDELRRECIKHNYDPDKIVALIRDIRRNYIDSKHAWRPWIENNNRAFKDPQILPEVRMLSQAYLERYPMNPFAIKTMAEIEDEEHLSDFLKKYTTKIDCSERTLLFERYLNLGDAERFEPERRFQLFDAFDTLLSPKYFLKIGYSSAEKNAADIFMENLLTVIRFDAKDEGPDMWTPNRLELGFKTVARLIAENKNEEALNKLESLVTLLEKTMEITSKVILPTSCRFIDGMEWSACEDWSDYDNNPDSPEERIIYMETRVNGMCACYCIFPRDYYNILSGHAFDNIRDNKNFQDIFSRVKALVKTRAKESN